MLRIHGPCTLDDIEDLLIDPIVGISAPRHAVGRLAIVDGASQAADQFCQSSRLGNQALLQTVDRVTSPRSGLSIVEFFAGQGNLTQVLANGADRVVAIDLAAPRSRESMPNVKFVRGDVTRNAQSLIRSDTTFDVAVLDPPRQGATALIEPLRRLAPPRIIYVSCDPATLARDTKMLADLYTPVRAHPIDLMPQTCHVEIVLELEKTASPVCGSQSGSQ